MRIAAGIMLLVIGLGLTYFFVDNLISTVANPHPLLALGDIIIMSTLVFTVCASLVAGGVFCIKRTHWRVCFGSTWLLILVMLIAMNELRGSHLLFVTLAAILPVIFVGLSRKEWQKSQA